MLNEYWCNEVLALILTVTFTIILNIPEGSWSKGLLCVFPLMLLKWYKCFFIERGVCCMRPNTFLWMIFFFPTSLRRACGSGSDWEQHLSDLAFAVESTEGASSRLLPQLISNVVTHRAPSFSRGSCNRILSTEALSGAAVLLMSP